MKKVMPSMFLKWFAIGVCVIALLSLVRMYVFPVNSLAGTTEVQTDNMSVLKSQMSDSAGEYSYDIVQTGREDIDIIIAEFVKDYVNDFKQQARENPPKAEGEKWSVSVSGNFEKAFGYISYHISGYEYSGGVHSNNWNKVFVFTEQGLPVDISDIAPDTKKLYALVAEYAQKGIEVQLVSEDGDIDSRYEKLSLIDTDLQAWAINSSGIQFWFDQCVALPCIYGSTSIVIPWEQVQLTLIPSIALLVDQNNSR
jgi:hypothetical protein